MTLTSHQEARDAIQMTYCRHRQQTDTDEHVHEHDKLYVELCGHDWRLKKTNDHVKHSWTLVDKEKKS